MMSQGMVLTQRYVRDLDLSRQYEQTEFLPAQATFGMIERNSEWFTVVAIGGFIVLGRLYGSVRWMLANEDRNPNIGFYRVSINPVMDSYPSQGYLS